MSKAFNLQNIKFGRLFVLNELPKRIAGQNKKTQILWHCVCDCGNDVWVSTSDLLNGIKTNCGYCKKESRNS